MRFLLLVATTLALAACGPSDTLIPSAHAQANAPGGYGTRVSYELVQVKEQNDGGIGRAQGADECGWPGTAASGNLSVIFTERHREIRYAYWVATIAPNHGGARLVIYDDIDYQMVELARTPPSDRGDAPTTLGGWVAQGINDAILAADATHNHKFIAVQVCGDAKIYTSSVYVQTMD